MSANQHDVEARPDCGAGTPQLCGIPQSSQQVSWWTVHEFITALAGQGNNLPPAGTPSWCAMPDSDPRKLLSLALAGEHHVLRTETAQIAMADASREISAAADWTTLAQRIRNRSGNAYIPRRKSA